ncbi:MAG: hypothetical protein HYX78_05090 [Armatimonadetes bacterium]|nr:hypothetical protein [Armatimonadota bacterium]
MADNGTTPQPLTEQTSSSENHYELMAIAQALFEWFGLDQERPHLERMADDLSTIRTIMEQSWHATEQLQQEAQRVLALHEQSAGEYLRRLDDDADAHPFQSVPAGTTIRDLPDGGRLFSFSDGVLLRVLPDGEMVSVGEDGAAIPVPPSRAGKVTLPGGRELSLVSDAITVTHESCGIEGLPHDVEPTLAADGRYTVTLADGTRLDVLRREKLIVIANPTGTVNIVGIGRIEGVGEEVQARSISGGSKSFRAMESGHAGMIEVDGTIHLSLASGLDLAIHFPQDSSDGSNTDTGAVCFDCQEHE